LNPLGYQWFDFQSGDPALIWKGVLEAARILNSFINEQLEKYNLSDDNLALIGFSQGTMMSLHVGLRREKPMRALVGFSGKLIGEELLKDDLVSKPPIYLIHGEQDPMVPHQETINAAEVLKKYDVEVQKHISPNTPHSIAEDGLKIAIDFLSSKFSK
jgi:phospholipase/carboxylesterase